MSKNLVDTMQTAADLVNEPSRKAVYLQVVEYITQLETENKTLKSKLSNVGG